MKVLHVIAGLGEGGAEAMLVQLCKSDAENEHIVVSLMDDGKHGAQLRAAGVSVHCLGMPKGRVTPRGLWELYAVLKRTRPRVVQTWMYHADLVGGIVARLAGIEAVCWGLHTSTVEPATLGRPTYYVARQCARLSRFIPRRIISCSEEGARRHAAIGYSPERLTVIHNGYDIQRFSMDGVERRRIRIEWGLESDEIAIGTVARFDPLKDHANLFAAMQRLQHANRKVVWVLVGSGMTDQNATVRAMLREAGVSCRILLLGSRPDVPRVMNGLDIHVLSSRIEGFPNVLAEAMACGTPCVTTAVGDAAIIVGDTGWVVPTRDSAALATAVERALHSLGDRSSWDIRRAAARQRVADKFSAEHMCKAYRLTWEGTLSKAQA